MVVLSKIYTKKGDDGKTELGDGKRIVKFSTRVEAYGTVDELNAMIGTITSMNIETKLNSCLERIQNDLFDLGADLCLPEDTTGHINPEPLRVEKSLTERLESEIDNMLAEREKARDSKDWATSDSIRDKLKEMGIEIQDTLDGAKWRRI